MLRPHPTHGHVVIAGGLVNIVSFPRVYRLSYHLSVLDFQLDSMVVREPHVLCRIPVP